MNQEFPVDWRAIRPLNGKRDQGFEELCSQLARAETPEDARFIRKGSPDAGVECYAILTDGAEWAWQAKYFDVLRAAQWSQLDDSVRTAIEKHPELARYYICVPFDLPDARSNGRTFAKDRWDERVLKWTEWASKRGMDVEFIYWGSHELLNRLARPEHVGRVRFWFDKRAFDSTWFTARLKEARQTAGPRYTPEIHVDLPIAQEFEAFGRTNRFFDQLKAHARTLREEVRRLGYSHSDTSKAAVGEHTTTVREQVQSVIESLAAVEEKAIGTIPFVQITNRVGTAICTAEDLTQRLDELEREYDSKPKEQGEKQTPSSSYRRNPFREPRLHIIRLDSALRETREALHHAQSLADNRLLLLLGTAGTGKTHLMCDVARRRLDEGRPTLLLMGQQFRGSSAPWIQALGLLDLAHLSAEEFVGALEAAAEAAETRALFMIDALNEGAGRRIWPHHLATFIARLECSPWIGVVLSIRSSYEELIIPHDVRNRAATATHHGFEDHEYDAAKTFFEYYELELPSTPLLSPEFRNPLFLKTLCRGLHAQGERRLPRGFHGITSVFQLYLQAANERLADLLDYHPRLPLVKRALNAFAEALVDTGDSWLTISRAAEIVNNFLPDRTFGNSLYRGLVDDGVLIEEAPRHGSADTEEIVFAAYERLSDHLIGRLLLDRHLDENNPALAFADGGPLAYICDRGTNVSPGLLQALCVQVPERTGQELLSVAPGCSERWQLGDAFRQSLIWRAHDALGDDTRDVMNQFIVNDHALRDTLDVLLTVATLPDHPLNAHSLDRRLREDTLAERDSWWSVYLHRAWGARGPVDRLVHWASSVAADADLEDETVELCGIALAWMLTTSNRFLRDRATKALVSLFTKRLAALARLVESFADIDDPYISERIHAVSYGVAMRSHDPEAVGHLAEAVYGLVFSDGSPPPHILLRDYARGVVERALYLGASIEVVPDRIRPPYTSVWPEIPTEEQIAPFLPDRDRGSYDGDPGAWARNRIHSSVMEDDFERYVVGSVSNAWLSVRLADPPWEQPSEEVLNRFGLPGTTQAPRFRRDQIQRYVLSRVFDLGWTTERFGHFDRFDIGYHGRSGAKAERIGKKYQWIALHEIMALVADHYQYRLEYGDDGDRAYEGPWQRRLRDIDPSCTMRTKRGGTSWHGHATAWWGGTSYDSLDRPANPRDWVLAHDDLPRIDDLLVVTKPLDNSQWLNGDGYFNWQEKPSADQEPYEVEHCDLWYMFNGYLIRRDDAKPFLSWAEEVDFWNRWMPEPPEVSNMYLGEHGWAPASLYFQSEYYGDQGWTTPPRGCPAELLSVSYRYSRESGGYDCSIDKHYELRLPVGDLLAGLGLRWSGHRADYVDAGGRLIVQDPTAHAEGPDALLFRTDALREFLDKENLTICWTVLGEKRILGGGLSRERVHPTLRMSGAYRLTTDGPIGFVKGFPDASSAEVPSSSIEIFRSGD